MSLVPVLGTTAQASPPSGRAPARVQLPAGDGLGKGPLKLSAGRLKLNAKGKSLELSQGVKVSLGKLRLSSETLTAQVDSKGGKVETLLARGKVRILLGKSSGRAGQARVDPTGGVLELTGAPRLLWAPLGLTLEGRLIRLDLRSGLLTVEEARVSLSGGVKPGKARAEGGP